MNRIFFCCNLEQKVALNLGVVPEVFQNANGIADLSVDDLKNLGHVGEPHIGFLSYEDAIAAGISVESLSLQRAIYCELTWADIEDERERRKIAGVKVGENWFHTSVDSKIQHLGNKDTARDILAANGGDLSAPVINPKTGKQIIWKSLTPPGVEKVWVPLTCGLAFDIVEAIKDWDSTIHEAAEIHRIQMENASHPERYDYLTSLWPQTLEESLNIPA